MSLSKTSVSSDFFTERIEICSVHSNITEHNNNTEYTQNIQHNILLNIKIQNIRIRSAEMTTADNQLTFIKVETMKSAQQIVSTT